MQDGRIERATPWLHFSPMGQKLGRPLVYTPHDAHPVELDVSGLMTMLRLRFLARTPAFPAPIWALVLWFGVVGCAMQSEGAPTTTPADPFAAAGSFGTDPVVTDPNLQILRSAYGAVAAASPWAAEAGAHVLAEGGNAVDAAIAAAWVLAVTEPSMSGIGGRAAGILRHPDGSVVGIDGLNQVPQSYRPDVAPSGYDRSAIPGVPAALEKLRAEHGTWPMDRLLAWAIEQAEEGFVLREPEADRWAGAAEDLRAFPAALGTYLQPDGTPWPAGSVIRHPDLARTLRAMAEEGVEVFYSGWVADSIDADMRRRGGFVTAPELAAYQALPAIVVEGTYRGHTLLGTFRPASGHSVIQALQIFEAASPEGAPGQNHPIEQARWMALLGQSMDLAIGERNRVEGSEEASAAFLTSLERAREQAQTGVEEPGRQQEPGLGEPEAVGAERLSAVSLVAAGYRTGLGSFLADPRDQESTTHLTAMDAEGRIVSLTLSLGPSMGSRVVAPGLGFLYATRLGTVPGSRPSSTISPTLVLRPDGSLLAGLGGAGDARIISAVIQTIARMVDHDLPLPEAVAAARVHPDGERHLRAETGPIGLWEASALDAFTAGGFRFTSTPSSYFGRVHAIGWDPATREVLAVAEPRWDGGVSAPRRAPVSPHGASATP